MYQLRKPDLTGVSPHRIADILRHPEFRTCADPVNQDAFLFWDKVRFKNRPPDVTAEEFWAAIKEFRKTHPDRVQSPVATPAGGRFSWFLTPRHHQILTQAASTFQHGLFAGRQLTEYERRQLLSGSLQEESIASAQLEGAATTRPVAKQMLKSERPPRTKDEQMIVNNHRLSVAISEDFRDDPLTVELLLELHRIATEETLDESQVGRFRTDKDEIVVADRKTGEVVHVPPPHAFLVSQIEPLLEFANDHVSGYEYVDPLIRAIILHFWIGYLHPFTDGNGRVARALFYWYAIRHGYDLLLYTSLSLVIKQSPDQYLKSYVYSEQDDFDLTYFVDYNLKMLLRSINEYREYLSRKMTAKSSPVDELVVAYDLNRRQKELLLFLFESSGNYATIQSHADTNQVTRMTARRDLQALEEVGLLVSKKVGRERRYFAGKVLHRK